MFSSLRSFNFRIWFAAALVSNVGMWMQRTAQDWIVLTELSDDDASALGINMALQFAPPLLLFPIAGLVADRFNRRVMLVVTQGMSALFAAALAVIVLLGAAELWHLYAFSFALGVVAAFDNPVRQAFVTELVGRGNLQNAVSLNSASFNVARMLGPAFAGGLVVLLGAGMVFALNAVTFLATIGALIVMRRGELHPEVRPPRGRGQIIAGFRYVRGRNDLMIVIVSLFIIGTFGLNIPIYTSTMARIEFGLGAGEFGLLSSIVAIGSVSGALMAARRDRPRLRTIFIAAAGFGVSTTIAAVMPTYTTFAVALVLVGFTSITIMTTANSYVQTTTDSGMRGRVVALYFAILIGGTTIGAPMLGWVADTFGPRWSMAGGAFSGVLVAVIGLIWMLSSHEVRLRYDRERRTRFVLSISRTDGAERALADLAITEPITDKT